MIHNLTKQEVLRLLGNLKNFFQFDIIYTIIYITYYKEDYNDYSQVQVVMNHVIMFLVLFNVYIILTPICTNLSLDLCKLISLQFTFVSLVESYSKVFFFFFFPPHVRKYTFKRTNLKIIVFNWPNNMIGLSNDI